jgi:polyisoprenoid-binding protein YceI
MPGLADPNRRKKKKGQRLMTIDVNEPAKAGLAHFIIDAKASRFTVQAFASGILSAMGHNPKIGIRTFGGAVDFNPETLEGGAFCLTVQSGSLAVQDDISDRDRREIERLMKDDVLEIARYPEIRYEAATIAVSRVDSALYSATLNGNLSLHGVTRGQPIGVRIATFGDLLRTSGDFSLRQSDYQIKPVSVAGGALKLKDEVKFSFEMAARKQE